MKNIKYLFILIGLIVLSSCFFAKKLYKKQLQPYTKNLEVQYRLVHDNGKQSKLFVNTNAKNYEITIKAYENYKAKTLLFEEIAVFYNALDKLEQIKIAVPARQYVLELSVKNIATKEIYSDVLDVDKTKDNEQTIIAYQENEKPLICNYTDKGTTIRFKHVNAKTTQLFIKYFDEEFRASRAPFIHKSWKFSSTKSFKSIEKININEPFKVDKKGLYFIQSDTSTVDGLFLNCFSNNFPTLTNAQDLVASTRYITKNIEYKKLTETDEIKNTLDAFWLERGGTKQRSRELIKAYYNRVQRSNRYFTTYKEGWKTDRGIIYIIFGKPLVIKKTPTFEYWYYTNSETGNSYDFNFNKKDGQYLLRRSQYYEYHWKDKIFEWRKGLIQE